MEKWNLSGSENLNFARARACAHARSMILSFCLVITSFPLMAVEPSFILGTDSQIHGIQIDHSNEQSTRDALGLKDTCGAIKQHPAAYAFVGSEGASIDPRITSSRGLLVLEGLRANTEPKILNTRFLGPYKNYPASIMAETVIFPGSRYPMAITIAASLVGSGDLVLKKSDYVILHADGQLFMYPLAEIILPSEGVLRLYLGTDDTLYYDAALTHPVHSGACGSRKK